MTGEPQRSRPRPAGLPAGRRTLLPRAARRRSRGQSTSALRSPLTRRGDRLHRAHLRAGPGEASALASGPGTGAVHRALRRERRLLRLGTAAAAVAAAAFLFPWRLAAPGPADAGSLPGYAGPPGVRASASASVSSPPVALTLPGHPAALPVAPVTADRRGVLAVPDSPRKLGWWAPGARPGAAHGTVLIAGHLDSTSHGPGPFERLHTVPIGARAVVTTADGVRHPYRVTARRTHPVSALPDGLFTTAGPPRLVLVTCTGAFDPEAHAYADNLFLYAEPAGGGSPAPSPSPSASPAT
ncbi:hypothetical protein C6N75_15780 [Streptomyces solincola]|uniref:Class F sortase n=1 Tax=Streptomyces solincola TaxID=2100817 RepID=A0A2S9PVB3_9ACTN|nr:class F sortase [Streptomyces solincola]PRH78277.1 hypothetical protein C6N75_15780 [Streptomyces solincola]